MTSQIFVLFSAVFVSMTGVGLVAPMLPLFGDRAGAGPELITFVIAVFSLGQFVAAPAWGWMSDRWGRKPMLVLSLLGAVVAYGILAIAETYELLLLSRLLGGLMAGNVAIAFAAVTDVTTPEERPKVMGRLGAAFGLGFILGPALGAALAGTDQDATNFMLLATVAGGLNGLAALLALVLFKNKETAPKSDLSSEKPSMRQLLSQWGFLRISIANFLFFCAVSMLESTIALLAYLRLDLGPAEVGILYTFLATTMVIMQTTAIGPLVKLLGNSSLLICGGVVYAVGLLIIGFAPNIWLMAFGLFFCALGNASFIPTSTTMASQEVDERVRGAGLGIFQATGSLGRALPPLISGIMFSQLGMSSPVFAGAALIICGLVFLMVTSGSAVTTGEAPEQTPADQEA